MIPQVGGFQGCYLDNHRNNWRCARAVPALCENAPYGTVTDDWCLPAAQGVELVGSRQRLGVCLAASVSLSGTRAHPLLSLIQEALKRTRAAGTRARHPIDDAAAQAHGCTRSQDQCQGPRASSAVPPEGSVAAAVPAPRGVSSCRLMGLGGRGPAPQGPVRVRNRTRDLHSTGPTPSPLEYDRGLPSRPASSITSRDAFEGKGPQRRPRSG